MTRPHVMGTKMGGEFDALTASEPGATMKEREESALMVPSFLRRSE